MESLNLLSPFTQCPSWHHWSEWTTYVGQAGLNPLYGEEVESGYWGTALWLRFDLQKPITQSHSSDKCISPTAITQESRLLRNLYSWHIAMWPYTTWQCNSARFLLDLNRTIGFIHRRKLNFSFGIILASHMRCVHVCPGRHKVSAEEEREGMWEPVRRVHMPVHIFAPTFSKEDHCPCDTHWQQLPEWSR